MITAQRALVLALLGWMLAETVLAYRHPGLGILLAQSCG